jgi:hypothetical protein
MVTTMHYATRQLCDQIIGTSLADTQTLACLNRAYDGETAYVLCCGKSFTSVEPAVLHSFLQKRLVVSVKQTYECLRGIADFHVYNGCNFRRYEYTDPAPIRIVASPNSDRLGADIFFPIQSVDFSATVVSTKNIEGAQFRGTDMARPWGPGCVYDIVFPLLIWMGVKRIVTLGFDVESIHKREYFYGQATHFSTTPERLTERELIAIGIPLWYQWMQLNGIEWLYVAHNLPTALSGFVPSVEFGILERL